MSKKKLTAKETFSLASQHHKKNNFKIAEKLYNEVLKTIPNHFESIFLLGTLHAQTKNFDKAKDIIEKLLLDENLEYEVKNQCEKYLSILNNMS